MLSAALVVISRPFVLAAWQQWAQRSLVAYQRAWSGKQARIADHRPADVLTEPAKFQEWTVTDLKARVRDLDRGVFGSKSTVRLFANVTREEFPLSDIRRQQIEAKFAPKMPTWYQK